MVTKTVMPRIWLSGIRGEANGYNLTRREPSKPAKSQNLTPSKKIQLTRSHD